ncbi:hypothetical protein [Rummeliibacillus sp. SL167]|uniref:hypothetical protein n=1 Tax=Rummeliibacillus sp. SL167 TaxID=2579792 RepID=UPI0011B472F3|nr:hypothetical protein [Rummeliibacillus sp. SL167]
MTVHYLLDSKEKQRERAYRDFPTFTTPIAIDSIEFQQLLTKIAEDAERRRKADTEEHLFIGKAL